MSAFKVIGEPGERRETIEAPPDEWCLRRMLWFGATISGDGFRLGLAIIAAAIVDFVCLLAIETAAVSMCELMGPKKRKHSLRNESVSKHWTTNFNFISNYVTLSLESKYISVSVSFSVASHI